jgi:hypothetical protein
MRSLAFATFAVAFVAAAVTAPPDAHGRLFWQTYGSTVPTAEGCAWNLNSDYFVPRHCDSCRYGLFSPCKAAHSLSPACKYLHPVYGGYCTPYGPCHYRWRDHVYKKYCCCTPLRYVHGPWKLEKCRKHCWGTPCGGPQGCGCGFSTGCVAGGTCTNSVGAGSLPCGDDACCEEFAGALANVEPLGGESLGDIAALPASMAGTAVGGMMGAAGQPLPALPMPSSSAGGASFSLPGIFGN